MAAGSEADAPAPGPRELWPAPRPPFHPRNLADLVEVAARTDRT